MQGQIINGFILKKLLGRGGMAEVWYAENEIGRTAAVKILNENLMYNQQIVERFHNEALVMVKLNHPNIRQVYGYGYLGKRHCIVMEYLEGSDLEELMKNGRRFTDEELRRWWNQTVDALNYTHAMGVVHRDIKPSNIFLDEKGNIKLLDFGIAKMMENASLTQTGMVMGTPMYMSPEQVNDIKHVDYHTDLYSLAVSFVHMLTGKKPYDDTNCSVFEIQMNIVTKPLDLSEVPANWRGFLAPYLEKDLQKRPALRHFEEVQPAKKPATIAKDQAKKPNKEELKATRVAPQQEKPIQEPLPSEPSEKPKSKAGLWIGLGVAAVAAVAVLVFFFITGNSAEKTFLKGKAFYDEKNYTKALPLLTKAAEKGNPNAQFCLGRMYYDGLGVEESHEESAKWYRKAAEQGDESGQLLLAIMYSSGDGVEENYEEAAKWFRKAAEQGDPVAQASLGALYLIGRGVVMQDYDEAISWIQKSVAQGNMVGQFWMGHVYKYGMGVDEDVEEAKKWYQKAAEQGDLNAIGALEQLEQEAAVKGGVFSVSASTKVHFSKGNLQYQASTGKWRFAPNPWDVIGEANENISSTYSGWIDLFGWGTGDDPTKTSKERRDNSSFVDWGSKYGGGWRTLTEDEWRYVLDERNTASGIRWAGVTLNGVKGFILLPDDWNGSTFDLTCTNQTSSDVYTPEGNTIGVSTWNNTFEPAGAVFLPAAGMRDKYRFIEGDEVVGDQGNYWSSTKYDDSRAMYLYFYDYLADVLQIVSRDCSDGYSVRLVCPVK